MCVVGSLVVVVVADVAAAAAQALRAEDVQIAVVICSSQSSHSTLVRSRWGFFRGAQGARVGRRANESSTVEKSTVRVGISRSGCDREFAGQGMYEALSAVLYCRCCAESSFAGR